MGIKQWLGVWAKLTGHDNIEMDLKGTVCEDVDLIHLV